MYRVDNIPRYLRPFFRLFGWTLGIGLYLYGHIIHALCQIRFSGTPLSPDRPAVYCIWHEDLTPYFSVFTRAEKQVWMSHPAWFMYPIQVMKRLTGIEKLYLGSSGNSGKEALAGVVADLKRGYSTTVACDGPAGPPYELKPGVLLMSRDSGLPVIPLRFECSRFRRMKGWDKKKLPLPFSTITVVAGEPCYATDENMDELARQLTDFLNGESSRRA